MSEVAPIYLEDASGPQRRPRRARRGARERRRSVRHPERGQRSRHSGDGLGRGHGSRRRPRALRRLGALAGEVHAPGNPPGLCHRGRGRAAARSARRRPGRRTDLSARPHRNQLLHRRQHRLQCQRLAQFPLRPDRGMGGAPARGAGRWPHARFRTRRPHRFRARRGARCRASPRTRPGTCSVPAWIGWTSSSGPKAPWAW